jgi:hypothetical protein
VRLERVTQRLLQTPPSSRRTRGRGNRWSASPSPRTRADESPTGRGPSNAVAAGRTKRSFSSGRSLGLTWKTPENENNLGDSPSAHRK